MSGPFLGIVGLVGILWCFAFFLIPFAWFVNKKGLAMEMLCLWGLGFVVPVSLYLWAGPPTVSQSLHPPSEPVLLRAGFYVAAKASMITGFLGYAAWTLLRSLDRAAPFRSCLRLFGSGFLWSLPVAAAIPLGFLIDNAGLGVLWGTAAAAGLPWNFFFLPFFSQLGHCAWYTDIFRFDAIHKYFPRQCADDQGFKIYLSLFLLYASCIGAHINGMLFRALRLRSGQRAVKTGEQQPD